MLDKILDDAKAGRPLLLNERDVDVFADELVERGLTSGNAADVKFCLEFGLTSFYGQQIQIIKDAK
jgi:hypothetical protein